MGEYATYLGQSVKIGTCEDMYYLRAADRFKVQPEPNSVNIGGRDAVGCRFRFPWPDEDAEARPGHDNARHDFDRGVAVPGMTHPEGVDHDMVQFTARAGYLVSLPCPEGPSSHGLTIHRNGFQGAVLLCQQKLLADGRLVPVMRCGGCGERYRLEEPADIEALVVALRATGDRETRQDRSGESYWWHEVADRVATGAKLAQQ